MKKIMRRILLTMLCMLPIFALNVNAAGEDNKAPELKSLQVVESRVKAGEYIEVKITVDERGTGLKKAFIQFNNSERDVGMLDSTKTWAKPVYSSKTKLITYTFKVPTQKNTRSGDWFMGYLELYDAKGNFSRYSGNKKNNEIEVEGFSDGVGFTGKSHVTIYGTVGDVKEPVLNWIKIKNSVIEKPGTLRIEANITEASGLDYVQFDLAKISNSDIRYVKSYYSVVKKTGTHTYTFEIPINEKRHSGEWKIQELYMNDTKGNEAHYTTEVVKGSFADYYSEAVIGKVPTFRITGVQGDETKPKVTRLRVLNENQSLQKPGILEVEVDLKEEESGITNLEFEVNCTDSEFIDVKSREIYEYAAKGYEVYGDEQLLDKPLMTGRYKFYLPISSKFRNGAYEVHVRYLKDKAENEFTNYTGATLPIEFSVSDEFEYEFEVGIANEELLTLVRDMEEGKVGRILLSNDRTSNLLSKEVFDAIAGVDKTLVCYKDGYQWIIKGLDINPEKTKTINLTTRISTISKEMLSSNQKAICLSFVNNGELPGVIQFRFKSSFVKDFVGNEEDLHLYHVEEEEEGTEGTELDEAVLDEEIDFINDGYEEIPEEESNFEVVVDDADAWCYVDISHNSKYVVSASKLGKLTMKNAKVSGYNASYVYNGYYRKPVVSVKLAKKTLKLNKDYKVTYKNNKNVGIASITIQGIGAYKNLGSKKITFTIKPKATAITKLTAGKKAFTVKWAKRSVQVTGYHIQYSTSSKMTSPKRVTVKGTKTTSRTIKNLKAKKAYYVRVRTYKTVNGKTYYSAWTKARKITTK